MEETKPIYPIKVLDNCLSLLEFLAEKGPSVSIKELSEQLGIYPSTVHRILDTLRHRGYVEQNSESDKYQLGLKVFKLGMAKIYQADLIKEAMPYLRKLRDQSGETVHFSIMSEGKSLCLMKEESPHAIKMSSKVGKGGPLHCTASGKVLLAYMPKDERKKIIKKTKIPRFTRKTITDEKRLEEELSKVRKQGFALDRGEHERYVRCIAAPIRNHEGQVVAGISISGPAFRMGGDEQNRLREFLLSVSKGISERLGYDK